MTVRGLAAIDRRTTAARALLDFRRELLDNLGGEHTITAARLALVEMAVRTRLYLDHVDAFLMAQPSLIVKRARLRGRLLPMWSNANASPKAWLVCSGSWVSNAARRSLWTRQD